MGGTLDAVTLRRAMSLYLEALEEHREEIDSLNVFPVPDGDTGTNMLLTQRAVVAACEEAPADLPGLGEAVSRAALMGARGNSGVILSQILRGLCAGLAGDGEVAADEGRTLAEALLRSSEEARAAVAEPKEGTMLSVLADAARAAAAEDGSVEEVSNAGFRAASSSLERTPEQLAELREAGVVDAGGKGLVLLLDALRAAIAGGDLATEVGPLGPVGTRDRPVAAGSRYGHEVMYLIEIPDEDAPRLRASLGRLGDSVVVVGGGGTYSAHVHTDDPEAAIAAGADLGDPADARVTSLDEQVAARCIAADGLREVRADAGRSSADVAAGAGHALVAVTEGAGMARLFESLGALVVAGGPGNNPSVGDLVEAVERAPGAVVFLLANHRNVVPAAEAAAGESSTRVQVLGTGSMAHGLSVAAAYTPGTPDSEEIGEAMVAALDAVCWGELAVAEKSAAWRDRGIGPGDWLGLHGKDILAVGDDPSAVAVELCAALGSGSEGGGGHPSCDELLTLFVGADATDEDGERVAKALRGAFPRLEVEVQRGDQPRHPYLISIE